MDQLLVVSPAPLDGFKDSYDLFHEQTIKGDLMVSKMQQIL